MGLNNFHSTFVSEGSFELLLLWYEHQWFSWYCRRTYLDDWSHFSWQHLIVMNMEYVAISGWVSSRLCWLGHLCSIWWGSSREVLFALIFIFWRMWHTYVTMNLVHSMAIYSVPCCWDKTSALVWDIWYHKGWNRWVYHRCTCTGCR